MDNIKVEIVDGVLIIEYKSESNSSHHQLTLISGKVTRFFEKEILSNREDGTVYRFSFNVIDLIKFVSINQELFQVNPTVKDNDNIVDHAKFIVYQQYIEKIQEDESEKTINKPFRIKKNNQWKLKNFRKILLDQTDMFALPYVTKKNGIALLINNELKDTHYFMRKVISKISATEDKLEIWGNISTRFFDIEECKVEIIERGGERSVFFPAQITRFSNQKNQSKTRRHQYNWQIKTKQILPYLENLTRNEELSLDLFFVLKLSECDTPVKVRIGNPRFLTNYFMKGELATFSEKTQKWYSLVPYFTLKAVNLSFTYNMYDKDAYEYYRENKKNWKKIAAKAKNKDIWVIGERSYKAQDNGYHFFKYLREKHPEVEAYYVIRKDSLERQNVEPFGNIIEFNSKEHFEKIIEAKYICGTHHPDSLYPIRSREYIKNIRGKKVFLQHGVFGTKNIAPIYAKSVNEFYTDLFITSSQKERQIAITDLGYSNNEVVSTGLSRFETLFLDDIPQKRQLLIIPTWRDWITNNEIFEESEYLDRYRKLLFDERLKQFSQKNQMEIIFCLHPNMQDYYSYFQDAPVTLIKQGERDVQDLIKESMVMLTDYSSVGFDFSFLHKPIVYYQFDRNRFLGKYPSHLDLDNELPGDIVDNIDDVFSSLNQIAENGFIMQEKYVKRANDFIEFRDRFSNDRIYQAVRNIPDTKRLESFLKNDTLILKIKNKFRHSKPYFPTMKIYFFLKSHFSPVVENRIFFESSLGKRYEDSPRAIYEKMNENGEKFEYIWVSNTNEPLKVNANTKIVRRLSIDYYKYLATSKYWVNNQNFPSYLRKRKDSFYLQTWHGTPVKKMQHDLEEIEGRDKGYLKRVTNAKNQWSALVSPSEYASKAFRSAFDYSGPIIEEGYPRNDIFYSDNSELIRIETRKKLNISPEKKVILYAPTFRDSQKSKGKFVMKNKLNFKIFERRLGKDFVLLIREHVVVSSKLKIPSEFRDNIIDVSKYPSIQELMTASDLLITDYSSVMFDYLNTNKPIYFYCYDIDEYDEMRGFYFNLEQEAPGPIVKNSSNLFRSIIKEDYWKKYSNKYMDFKKKFTPLDGKDSSEKVYKSFLEKFGGINEKK